MGFTPTQTIVHWSLDYAEGSIPFTRSNSPPFSLNGLPLRYSSGDSDSHNGFNINSSVHSSIINAPKGIVT